MHRRSTLTLAALLITALAGCYRGPVQAPNPAAPGFDAQGSDPRAIEIADEVMQALGGRERWDATRVISWTSIARRRWMWDRQTGDVRVDYLESPDDRTVAFNAGTRRGRVWQAGVEVSDPAEVARLAGDAWRDWNEDSYWLVMPYELKGHGVRLGYAGERAGPGGQVLDVLVLTFEDPPQGVLEEYEVLVHRDLRLVVGWSAFEESDDAAPRFSTPWLDWSWYGGIQLSSHRGDQVLTDIQVLTAPPPGMMTAPTGP